MGKQVPKYFKILLIIKKYILLFPVSDIYVKFIRTRENCYENPS